VRTKKPGKDGLPRSIHDVSNVSTPPPDGTVDMTHEDEGRWVPTMKVRNLTSTVIVKENRLTPMSPPLHNRRCANAQCERRCLCQFLKRLASALTLRHAMRRATMTS
jgi:hypothetical protein